MGSFNRRTDNWCCGCNNPKARSQFYPNLNENYEDLPLPFCRHCIAKKIKEYRATLGSDGAALYCVCAELGYPLISELWEETKKVAYELRETKKDPDIFYIYNGLLKNSDIKVQGLWQSDKELSDFIQIGRDRNFDVVEEKEPDIDYAEQEIIWGRYSPEEYQFLNQFFKMYTKDFEGMDTALELRYRDLCKAELMKRKADEEGDIALITKAQTALKSQLDLLKLSDFDSNKKSDVEKHIERLIWKIEHTKPVECEDLNKYKDFSGFEKPFGEIMRCLKNLVAGTREYPEVPKGER